MDYFLSLTIPPGTSREDEAWTSVLVPPGTITQVRILIPWGVAGLAGVRITANEVQVYPSNMQAYYTGNDTHIVINDRLHLTDDVTDIKVLGYNMDDSYDHTFYVGISLDPDVKEETPSYIGMWQVEGWE